MTGIDLVHFLYSSLIIVPWFQNLVFPLQPVFLIRVLLSSLNFCFLRLSFSCLCVAEIKKRSFGGIIVYKRQANDSFPFAMAWPEDSGKGFIWWSLREKITPWKLFVVTSKWGNITWISDVELTVRLDCWVFCFYR